MFRFNTSRREFLAASSMAVAGGLVPARNARSLQVNSRRPRVAAIFTILRFRSHAYNILENFLGPYYFRGELVDPGVDVVSLYADQFPEGDLAREVAVRFGIPLCETIEEAMCVGSDELAVDAVLSIGEHGDYPYNARGQHMYPRKRFFDEALAVMDRADRYVPFFNDKHLSYRWDQAQEMYDICRSREMPLIAGSSVPLAQRIPAITLPLGAEIEESVSVHGGGLESYDFHGLEVLQSFVEARRGGETGIAEVQLLWGDAFKAAQRAGRWSQELVDAAMDAETDMAAERQPFPRVGPVSATPPNRPDPPRPDGPHAICLTYNDGLKATVLTVDRDSNRWNFACKIRGREQPLATAIFNSPWGNRGLFKALSHAIQHTFRTGREPFPAERTLLTTGALDAVMRSFEQEGAVIETPDLDIAYETPDWSTFRESGATWEIITRDVQQPTEFAPRSWDALRRS